MRKASPDVPIRGRPHRQPQEVSPTSPLPLPKRNFPGHINIIAFPEADSWGKVRPPLFRFDEPVVVGITRPLAYIDLMEFEWDEVKSDGCFAERGFDFAYAVRVFLDPDRMIERDERFDYAEHRYRVLGRIEGRVFVVVYTRRSAGFRIISARKANRREVQRYEAGTGNTGA
jgi:uncharacterized DUF497 family protein